MSYYTYEKVSPAHPDKIADRIAGALVDACYIDYNAKLTDRMPHCAFEVLLGHGKAFIIAETDTNPGEKTVQQIVKRIAGIEADKVTYICVEQDKYLAENQAGAVKCGDNGIFKGSPLKEEERILTYITRYFWDKYKSDGKYLLNIENPTEYKLTVCQSHASNEELEDDVAHFTRVLGAELNAVINPLGPWDGGIDVDTGATNRKLGSDMGSAATGGGLHGKDLSKADVTINILCNLYSDIIGKDVYCTCDIGDTLIFIKDELEDTIDVLDYGKAVEIAYNYIQEIGGFEKFAMYGLIR